MRLLTLLLLSASSALAQGSVSTTFAGSIATPPGGGVFFDVIATGTSSVEISAIGANLEAVAGLPASFDVYVAPTAVTNHLTDTSAWTFVETIAVTTAGIGRPSTGALSSPLVIGAGTTRGMALVANGVGHRYSLPWSGWPTPAPSPTPPLCGLSIERSVAATAPFAPYAQAGYVQGYANVSLTVANSTCAIAEPAGDGCDARAASFYQQWTPQSFDLAGYTVVGQSRGGAPGTGYEISLVPSPGDISAGPNATVVPLANDTNVPMGQLGLYVSDNGWVAFGPGNSNNYVPGRTTMLGNPIAAVYAWTDLDPTWLGSAPVLYEESGFTAIITYDGVSSWGGGATLSNGQWTALDTVSFQIRIDVATGDFEIEFDAASDNLVEGWLVGYSPLGPSRDPGPTMLSAATPANPLRLDPDDEAPLTLTPVDRPVQTGVASAFQVVTSGVGLPAALHIGLVGLSRPSLPLAPLGFGVPGCTLHASPDVAVGPVAVTGTPNVTWTAFQLPAALFPGYEFHCQAVTLGAGIWSPEARASNGLRCVVGDF